MALRLDKYLTELGAGTRSEVKKQIKAGLVTVNGAVAKKPEQKELQIEKGNFRIYPCGTAGLCRKAGTGRKTGNEPAPSGDGGWNPQCGQIYLN